MVDFFIIIFLSGVLSVSHERSFRPTEEVRQAYGPTLDHFPRCLVLQSYEQKKGEGSNLPSP